VEYTLTGGSRAKRKSAAEGFDKKVVTYKRGGLGVSTNTGFRRLVAIIVVAAYVLAAWLVSQLFAKAEGTTITWTDAAEDGLLETASNWDLGARSRDCNLLLLPLLPVCGEGSVGGRAFPLL